jgi:hypothetical protein
MEYMSSWMRPLHNIHKDTSREKHILEFFVGKHNGGKYRWRIDGTTDPGDPHQG